LRAIESSVSPDVTTTTHGSAPGGSAVGDGSSVGSIVAVGIGVGMMSLMLGVVIVGPEGVAVASARVGKISGRASSGVGAAVLAGAFGAPGPPDVGVA